MGGIHSRILRRAGFELQEGFRSAGSTAGSTAGSKHPIPLPAPYCVLYVSDGLNSALIRTFDVLHSLTPPYVSLTPLVYVLCIQACTGPFGPSDLAWI